MTIWKDDGSHDDQVITSGWSKIVPETHVCPKWVDMDTKMILIVFLVHFRSNSGLGGLFFMIFRCSKKFMVPAD